LRGRSWLLVSLSISFCCSAWLSEAQAQQKYIYQGHEINKDQYDALMLFNGGFADIQKKDYAAAEKKLAEAVRLDPKMYTARTNYGYVLGRLGRPDESIAQLKEAVRLNPTGFEGLSTLASMYQANGNLTEAIDCYSQALKANPKHEMAPMIKSVIVQLTEARNKQTAIMKTIDPAEAEKDYYAFAKADGTSHWLPSRLPLKVFVPSDESCKGITNFRSEFNTAARQAFAEWQSASGDAVKFDYVPKASDADIEISWVDDPAKVRRPSEGGEARVQFDPVNGIRHSQIVLLTKMPEATDDIVPLSTIKFAAMHEIGHSLGILGHSPNSKDVMFCSVPAAIEEWHVTARDGATLAHIYSQGNETMSGTSSGIELATSGNFADAAKQFEAALKENPNYEPAKQNLAACLNNLAILAAKDGKYAEAAPNFKRALDLMHGTKVDKKRVISTMHNYAFVLEMLNRKTEALSIKAAADKLAAAP
jgi:tetratricopeptide (TPR) repeat protein